jgi:DNA-binding XRE family transcriptional regulator
LPTNAELFKKLRAKLRLSQVEYAKKLSISEPMVIKIEKGASPLSDKIGGRFKELMAQSGFTPETLMSEAAPALSDRERGYFEGRIEELEKQVRRHETQMSEVLNSVVDLLQSKKIVADSSHTVRMY